MTWRRFAALLCGLSADSRWVHAARADRDGSKTLDRDAGQAYFRSIASRG